MQWLFFVRHSLFVGVIKSFRFKLFNFLTVFLPVLLSICLFFCLFVFLTIRFSVRFSINRPLCLSACELYLWRSGGYTMPLRPPTIPISFVLSAI